MRISLLCCGFLAASLAAEEISLADYARGKALPIYTYTGEGSAPLGKGDNINNFKGDDKVLQLSRLGLNNLEGIARLRVVDQGVEKPISQVERLHLYLNSNAIRTLPPEFFTLQNIEFLYLNFNRMDAIPPEIAGMKGLLGMYFTANNISEIPAAVYTMTWLRKLQVSKNHLTRLDPAIGRLNQLRHFNLSDNRIEVLPDTIGNLKLLRVCDFSDNRIARLPESFGEVPIVHQLRVCNNPLRSLPAGFAKMPGSIDVTGTQVDVASLPPALRAKIIREKVTDKKKPAKAKKP